MRKVDKGLRRLNWPAIEKAIGVALRGYVMGKNKAVTRKYYVDGIEPVYPPAMPGLDSLQPALLIRLLCEPEATEEQWEEWKQEFPNRDSFLSVLQLQRDPTRQFYFGNNSLFNHREAEIQEFWYKDRKKEAFSLKSSSNRDGLEKKREDRDILNVLSPLIVLKNESIRMKRNPHSFYSTSFDYEFDYIVKCLDIEKDLPVIYDEEKHCIELTHRFCPLECVHRHPERFDSGIQYRIKRLHDYFVDSQTHPVLLQAYRQTIEMQFDRYIEYSGAGASISVCLRYDHPDQLQAMLPLLYEETRYPCQSSDPDGTIHCLPNSTGDRGKRRSFATIRNLWSAGFNAERHIELDEITLFVEFTAPLSWSVAQKVLFSLRADATNLENKLKARKMLSGDHILDVIDSASMVYLLKPIQGCWRAGAWARYADPGIAPDKAEVVLNMDIAEGENTEIDRIVNVDDSVEITLQRLLNEGYSIIRQKGHYENTGKMISS